MPRSFRQKHSASYAYSLDNLLAPVSFEEFRERHWEKDFLFISRNDPSFYQDLFSLQDVDFCIFSRRTDPRPVLTIAPPSRDDRPAKCRICRASEVTMESLYSSFRSGATIRLESVQDSWPPVALLVAALEEALTIQLNVNLYLTPPSSQGFKVHYDSHDALILQIEGAKEWSIYAPAIHLPMETSAFGDLPEVAEVKVDERSSRLLQTILLEPGDLLYIPRGFPHKAVAAETASLHLTLGIRPVSWLDFLKTAVENACISEPSLRHSMEPGFLKCPEALDRMRSAFGSVLRQACERADFDSALEALMRERFAAQPSFPDGHFAQWPALARLKAGDWVGRRSGLSCRVEREGDTALLHFATHAIRGPIALQPALEFMRDHLRFKIGDLPGLTENGKLILVRRAIQEGLLAHLPADEA